MHALGSRLALYGPLGIVIGRAQTPAPDIAVFCQNALTRKMLPIGGNLGDGWLGQITIILNPSPGRLLAEVAARIIAPTPDLSLGRYATKTKG